MILHELRSKQRSHEMFEALKETHPICVKVTDNACAVYSRSEANALFSRLKAHLKPADKLFILTISKPFTGHGPRDTSNWLSDYVST